MSNSFSLQRLLLRTARPSPTSSPSLVLIVLLLLLGNDGPFWRRNTVGFASAYPVITEIQEEENRCLRFTIPERDDAHVIVLALPNSDQMTDHESVESWYVQQVYKMAQLRDKDTFRRAIPTHLPDEAPTNVAKAMSNFLQNHISKGSMAPVKITLAVESYDDKRYTTNYRAKYFQPVVINHVRHHHAEKIAENFEGVHLCFKNEHEHETMHVIFDKILDSDAIDESILEEMEGGADGSGVQRFDKEKHLNPLESSIDHSLASAKAVIREMKYMETRENRMRRTAENINARVRWFSYLSVSVLLTVTYIQVTYLKGYFHKKKIL